MISALDVRVKEEGKPRKSRAKIDVGRSILLTLPNEFGFISQMEREMLLR